MADDYDEEMRQMKIRARDGEAPSDLEAAEAVLPIDVVQASEYQEDGGRQEILDLAQAFIANSVYADASFHSEEDEDYSDDHVLMQTSMVDYQSVANESGTSGDPRLAPQFSESNRPNVQPGAVSVPGMYAPRYGYSSSSEDEFSEETDGISEVQEMNPLPNPEGLMVAREVTDGEEPSLDPNAVVDELTRSIPKADEDPDALAKRRNRRLLIAALLVSAAVAIALGVVFGRPTDDPPPTIASNSVCEEALPFSTGSEQSGSLNALLETTTQPSRVPQCGAAAMTTTGGLWYSLQGTGTHVKAYTCATESQTLETQISVFSGGCAGLKCVERNSGFCGQHSVASWFAKADETYYVVVSGQGSDDDNFLVNVEAGMDNDECPTSKPLAIGGSEETAEALTDTTAFASRSDSLPSCGIENSVGLWYSVPGSGKGLTATVCYQDNMTVPSLSVYEGSCNELSCKVSISEQAEVLPETCSRFGKAVEISWRSVASAQYNLQIDSSYSEGEVNMLAAFQVSVSDFEATHDTCQEGIVLDPLELGLISGSTKNATRTGPYRLCDGDDEVNMSTDDSGVWYQIRGTGDVMQVLTCEAPEDVVVLVEVYEKTCEALSCLQQELGRSTCDFRWISEEGAPYYIFVRSAIGDPVEFELSIRSSPVAENDVCDDATMMEPDGRVYVGSTSSAAADNDKIFVSRNSPDDMSGCIFQESIDLDFPPGVWYSFVGTGREMRVSTCHEETDFATVVVVSSGGCGNLECFTSNIFTRGILCEFNSYSFGFVSISSVKDEVYHVLVRGQDVVESSKVGRFGISVESIEGVSNDDCVNAIPIEPTEGMLVKGSTIEAQEDADCITLCTPGVWYSTRGTGSQLRATIPWLEANFSATIAVYNGSCGNLNEVGKQVDHKYFYAASSVEWLSKPGEIYYIYIYGRNDQGLFGLELNEIAEAPSSSGDTPSGGCEGAPSIDLGSPGIEGQGQNAASAFDRPGCGVDGKFGVWYRLSGRTEGLVTVRTCDPRTQTNSHITIFAASSCSEICNEVASSSNEFFSGVPLPADFAEECSDEIPGRVVTWNADISTDYYVLIEAGPIDGLFVVTTSVDEDGAPPNDSCEKSTMLDPADDVIIGSTKYGEYDFLDVLRPACDTDGSRLSPGLWYKVMGTGSEIRLSTCTAFTETATFMRVFTGSCDGGSDTLLCVPGGVSSSDPSCAFGENASTLSWLSVTGEEYYVYVQGPTLDFAVFGIFVESSGTAVPLVSTMQDIPNSPSPSVAAGSLNERCSDAIELDPSSDTTYLVSTVNVTIDDNLPDWIPCDSENGFLSSPGVWFKVRGTGGGLAVSTCHPGSAFPSTFHVFLSETGECDSLVCIETRNDEEEKPQVSGTSEITFVSTCEATDTQVRTTKFRTSPGSIYYIFVLGNSYPWVGNIEVGVQEVELSSNDVCSESIPVQLDGSSSVAVGTTTRATPDDEVLVCEPYDNIRGFRLDTAGVWYNIAPSPEGNAMRVSTCDELTTFDTKVSVYVGDDCSNLSCIEVNDDSPFCQSRGSYVAWPTVPTETYFVQVHGYYGQDRIGNFRLTIEEFSTPENNDCEGALMLAPRPGAITLGSTANALASGIQPYCHLPASSPGVWYMVTGTGGGMRASTCTNETTYDTRLSVYNGAGCQTLSCVVANSDAGESCGATTDASTVSWNTALGQTYYIHVFGAPGAVGDFGLLVEEVDMPANSICASASPIDASASVIGSTGGASSDTFSPNCQQNDRSPGVWYVYESSGASVVASVCSVETNFAGQISVYQGSCQFLECVETTSRSSSCGTGTDAGTVTWTGNTGDKFHILVHGFGSESGNFELSIEEIPPPENDSCRSAAPLDFNTTVQDSVGSASLKTEKADCEPDEEPPSYGIWYSLDVPQIEQGQGLSISACSDAREFDAKVRVFTGDCSDLACVSTVDDSSSCSGGSSVRFVPPSIGESIFIYVYGEGDVGSGFFEVSVEVFDLHPNGSCENALPIMANDLAQGTTEFAERPTNLPFCEVAVDGPTAWYTYSPAASSSRTVTARVRSGFLVVYKGSCGTLECVGGESSGRAISFVSQPGETYYILVVGDGGFDLVILLENEVGCEAALPIALDAPAFIDTAEVRLVRETLSCDAVVRGPSQWFEIVGTGRTMVASTCSSSTSFDTVISLYSGGCDELICFGGNDDSSSCSLTTGSSQLFWNSVAGTVYHLLVYGFNGETGTFALEVTEL